MNKENIIPNTIYYTTNYEVLVEVVKKTDLVKNVDTLKEDFVRRLGIYITNKSGMVLVSFGEDKELNGCMVISRHIDRQGEYVWIDFAWCDSHSRYLTKMFYDEIIGTCRVRGIKRIQMRMKRGFKAMQKMYGTYEIARILEKEVI